jgi:hypothetical protein
MLEVVKELFDNKVISEEVKTSIQEAWDKKIAENRETVAAELREEFAQKFNHDKAQMIEAMDKLMNDKLSEEITRFVEDRKGLAEQKLQYESNIKEHSEKMYNFVMEKLAKEMQELNADRKGVHENFAKLEEFVIGALAKEISEFQADKQEAIDTKVALVREAKAQMAKLKENFIKKSAGVVEKAVKENLERELKTFKEDIKLARENNFGRTVFEAFANEFKHSYINENGEIAKVAKEAAAAKEQLVKAENDMAEARRMIESKETELKVQKDLMERKETMSELLNPLSKDQKAIMTELLESVDTTKLRGAFNKYLPAVMEGKDITSKKKIISEAKNSVEVTGNRESAHTQEDDNLTTIRRLAGIKQ